MARNEMFVTAYRLEVEAISDCAIVSNEESNVAIIVAPSDALGTTRLADMALRFFGKEGYNISTLGLLGPFKRLN